MAETNYPPVRSRVPNTWRSLLVLIGLIMIGMSVGNILAALLLMAVLATQSDFSMEVIATLLQTPDQVPNGWYALMLLQSTAHLFTFLVPSLVYWYYIERRTTADFNFREEATGRIWMLVLVLVIAFMPFNSLVIELNADMQLPHALQGIENWMRAKEDQLAELTRFLTQFESVPQLIIALLVIALIPAVGEELLFRGVLQRKLAEAWSNVHLSIWVSAALFSAIHVQFYGFFPRLLLGTSTTGRAGCRWLFLRTSLTTASRS
jgi:uncharacterized protein